jgi:hypothetical protein
MLQSHAVRPAPVDPQESRPTPSVTDQSTGTDDHAPYAAYAQIFSYPSSRKVCVITTELKFLH